MTEDTIKVEAMRSLEAEESVLGGCMLDPEAVPAVGLSEADFFARQHRLMWRAITTLYAEGSATDPVTVHDRLDAWGESDDVGGLSGVGQFALNISSAANIRGHARIVRDHSIRRALSASATTLIQAAHDRTRDISGLIQEVQGTVLRLSMAESKSDLAPLSSYVPAFLEDTERRFESGGMVGMETGHANVDSLLCGLEDGDFVVVAGRPSMGKSMLAAQWAEHVASMQKTVAFFSLEMPAMQLMQRSASRIGRIDFGAMRSGQLEQQDFRRLNDAVGRFKNLPIHIDDTPGLSFPELASRARRLHHKSPLSMVVVDYLQIVQPGDIVSRDARQDIRIGAISTGLKNLAKELGCPVIAVAQLNRGVDSRSDKRPQMSDLREAGQLEQDADVIAFIYRDEAYNSESRYAGLAEVIVRKQRNGPTGTAWLTFRGEFQRFDDADMGAVAQAKHDEESAQKQSKPFARKRGMPEDA